MRRGAHPSLVRQGRTSPAHPGGNRDANCTLHMITLVRLRFCQRTRDYAIRRTADGKSKKEIICCLRRYIAREV